MDIRFNALNSYSATGKVGATGRKASPVKSEKVSSSIIEAKADSISISSDAASYGEVYKLNNAIRSELDASSGADRIASIKEAIKQGTYSVSSDDVAGAILDRFV